MTNKLNFTSPQHSHEETEKHPKQDFQVERLAFFSDAVFAIVVTLLIIEFKVPTITNDSTYESVLQQLIHLTIHLFALSFSFLLIVIFWIRHHFLFKHIHNYNKQIVVANMIVLFTIIFFPFTTSFLAEALENEKIRFLAIKLFLLNNILAGFTIYALFWFAFVKHRDLSYEITTKEKIKFTYDTLYRTIMLVILFVSTFITNNWETFSKVLVVNLLVYKFIENFLIKRSEKI